MLKLFISSSEEQLDQISQALAAGDTGKVARLAHQIKGAAGYLGDPILVELAAELEQAGKASQQDVCAESLSDLEARFISLRLEIAPLVNG
jgi:HPt (histidine-containing phosphotransfer) domain-containing protein